MSNPLISFNIPINLVQRLITQQFPEFAHLDIQSVKIQGHDNRTFRLGLDMLVRMPTAEHYALKVPKEQELLPQLAPYLSVSIPAPLALGKPSDDYPFPFSIYKWCDGESANSVEINEEDLEHIALDLAEFLKELQNITLVHGPAPGHHNWWRGDHVSFYDKQARTQIAELKNAIDGEAALVLWENALRTRWQKPPVWIHGDLAYGNILIKESRLTGVIDFGGMGMGDPACDLVIAWTFLKGKSRKIFQQNLDLDADTWLRAKAWTVWKATFELCNIDDKASPAALHQKQIIAEILEEDTKKKDIKGRV